MGFRRFEDLGRRRNQNFAILLALFLGQVKHRRRFAARADQRSHLTAP